MSKRNNPESEDDDLDVSSEVERELARPGLSGAARSEMESRHEQRMKDELKDVGARRDAEGRVMHVDPITGEVISGEVFRENVNDDGIWDDLMDRAIRADPDLNEPYWGISREKDGVLYFASGTNHEGEIIGMMRAGYHVGVAVPEINKAAINTLKSLSGSMAVFVDSGAFSEVGFGERGPYIAERITPEEWIKRLAIYAMLSEALGDRLFVVAPDCVAHQRETLDRLERYAEFVQYLSIRSNVIVPVQKGELSMSEFWKRELEILGDGNWIAGIPMKKDATTVAELEAFVRDTDINRIHLLGLGPDSKVFGAAIAAIRKHRPACTITCDSVLLRRLVGRTNGRGGGPRALTQRRDELIAAGWDPENSSQLKEVMTATALLDRDAGKRSRLTEWLLPKEE